MQTIKRTNSEPEITVARPSSAMEALDKVDSNAGTYTNEKRIPVQTTIRQSPIPEPSIPERNLDIELQESVTGLSAPEMPSPRSHGHSFKNFALQIRWAVVKFPSFVGPGFLVSVAYMDPGNYATDVAAGASFKYKLLFVVLFSSIIAVFLQLLCVKLGTVTGLNLAENCKAHLPWYWNYFFYFFAEAAIVATDIAEVIGTAIALNILIKVPLVAGCALAIVDVLFILLFYNPTGMSMQRLRIFEFFVISLVLGVAGCFCFELSKIGNTSVGEVMRGYLPSSVVLNSTGLYQSCGILGATVMPHSLYLGSGIVQSRLKEFDDTSSSNNSQNAASDELPAKYRPSIAAIKHCLTFSAIELAISLFTFALFVNSAILIVSGASLSDLPSTETANADLFSIHDLLSQAIGSIAGTIFALALLLSGTSAGIVCTMAGQMVSEGQLSWTVKPWLRRLITRSISIIPSIIIAGSIGRAGLGAALEATQVVLSIILPFVSLPLVWFTCSSKIMKVDLDVPIQSSAVPAGTARSPTAELRTTDAIGSATVVAVDSDNTGNPSPIRDDEQEGVARVVMRNSWVVAVFAVLIWLLLAVLNVLLLVQWGKGVQ